MARQPKPDAAMKTSVETFEYSPGIGIAIEVDGKRHFIVIRDDDLPEFAALMLRALADKITGRANG
jgi:hypothetical protein